MHGESLGAPRHVWTVVSGQPQPWGAHLVGPLDVHLCCRPARVPVSPRQGGDVGSAYTSLSQPPPFGPLRHRPSAEKREDAAVPVLWHWSCSRRRAGLAHAECARCLRVPWLCQLPP